MATARPQYLSVIQHEVVKLLVLGSGGKLGVMPLRREDDFDLVVSIPEAGQSVIGLRIETASRLTSGPFGEWLVIESSMPPKHFQEDPRASYVFGHFSVEAMAFAGSLFVIPRPSSDRCPAGRADHRGCPLRPASTPATRNGASSPSPRKGSAPTCSTCSAASPSPNGRPPNPAPTLGTNFGCSRPTAWNQLWMLPPDCVEPTLDAPAPLRGGLGRGSKNDPNPRVGLPQEQ